MRKPNEPTRPANDRGDKLTLGEADRSFVGGEKGVRLNRPDPNTETVVLPADQFVSPGGRELPRNPENPPHPSGALHRRRPRDMGQAWRNYTLAAIAIVLITIVLMAVYFIAPH
jgi:hypothetical protein